MSIFLGLGSNIGDRFFYLQESLLSLQAESSVQISKVSSIYLTEPEGLDHEKNPGYFLNLVCKIETELKPMELLEVCLGIENKLGRNRNKTNSKKKSSRKIDIDLLYFRKLLIKKEKLTIPHPSIRERAFVILPLSEIIDINWRDPVDKADIQTLKNKLIPSLNCQKRLIKINLASLRLKKDLVMT